MKILKKTISILLLSSFFLTQGATQDILLIKEKGGVMEGYFQEVSKTEVVVKFGIYSVTMNRKLVDIIIGEQYESLKEEELLHPLDQLDTDDKAIKKAIEKVKRTLGGGGRLRNHKEVSIYRYSIVKQIQRYTPYAPKTLENTTK